MTTTRPDAAGPRAAAPIGWGFVGAGDIAGDMAGSIARTDGNAVVAVAARDGARAQAFADRHGARAAYGSYRELVEDPSVDVVYVNTTHPFHHEQALMAIAAGKPVLVEKPLALNGIQAEEIFAAARRAGVFAMEAMWMRAQPLIRRLRQEVADGRIGAVSRVHASMPVSFGYDATHRIFDPDNGGGALLDLGVYPATFAWLFLGQPDLVHVTGTLAPTGVDATVSMQWAYHSGASAHVFCSSQAAGPFQATILGTTGWIEVEPSYQDPPAFTVHGPDGTVVERVTGERGGFVPQVLEVERCLRAGLLESPLVPHSDTVDILHVLDAARSELGVVYPQERRRD